MTYTPRAGIHLPGYPCIWIDNYEILPCTGETINYRQKEYIVTKIVFPIQEDGLTTSLGQPQFYCTEK